MGQGATIGLLVFAVLVPYVLIRAVRTEAFVWTWRCRCGYSLRGLAKHCRCPECGEPDAGSRRRRYTERSIRHERIAPIGASLIGLVVLGVVMWNSKVVAAWVYYIDGFAWSASVAAAGSRGTSDVAAVVGLAFMGLGIAPLGALLPTRRSAFAAVIGWEVLILLIAAGGLWLS